MEKKGKQLILDENKIRELYVNKRKSIIQIAEIFGVGSTTIDRRLKKLGIRQKEKIQNLDKEKIINLYVNQGKIVSEIGKLFDVCSNTIYKILKEKNIKIIRPKCKLDEEKIINLYLEKKVSPYKIAKLFNCSIHPIYDIFKRNKIKLFPNGFFNKGKLSPIKGLTKETSIRVRKIFEKMKGRNVTWGDKISKTRIEKGIAKGKNNPMYGKKRLDWAELKKQKGYEEKRIKAMLKGLMKRPSSFEQKIILLCSKHRLPFVYTGDGRILIGYKNPDFIDEEKKVIIEVFLNYFKIRDYGSVENYIKQRGKHFAKYGYKTIFIREEEVMDKNWEQVCVNKIQGGLK